MSSRKRPAENQLEREKNREFQKCIRWKVEDTVIEIVQSHDEFFSNRIIHEYCAQEKAKFILLPRDESNPFVKAYVESREYNVYKIMDVKQFGWKDLKQILISVLGKELEGFWMMRGTSDHEEKICHVKDPFFTEVPVKRMDYFVFVTEKEIEDCTLNNFKKRSLVKNLFDDYRSNKVESLEQFGKGITEFMKNHDKQEFEKKDVINSIRNHEDDDGWIKVLPNVGTSFKPLNPKEKKSKSVFHKQFEKNMPFYQWQRREQKQKELDLIKEEFERAQKKISEIKSGKEWSALGAS